MASSFGRASSQKSVGTRPATSQRKPSTPSSRSQCAIISIMYARVAGFA